ASARHGSDGDAVLWKLEGNTDNRRHSRTGTDIIFATLPHFLTPSLPHALGVYFQNETRSVQRLQRDRLQGIDPYRARSKDVAAHARNSRHSTHDLWLRD